MFHVKWLLVLLSLLVTPAAAADLPVKAAPPAPLVLPWNGFYGGVSIGYGIDSSSLAASGQAAPIPLSVLASQPNGWLAGARIGYDWNASPIVIGIETDIQYANFQSGGTLALQPVEALNWNSKTNWWGSSNLRFGIPMGQSLLYGIGGFAYGNKTLNAVVTNGTIPGTAATGMTATAFGWDLGAGFGTMLTRNSEVFFEYRHIDLGSLNGIGTAPTATVAALQNSIFDTFMVGYNYHF
jgi:outer membrane immunogenic protein